METAIIIGKRMAQAVRRELWQKPKAVYYVWHEWALGWDAWRMFLYLVNMAFMAYCCISFNLRPPSGYYTFMAAMAFAWVIIIWGCILTDARAILVNIERADQNHRIGCLPETHPLARAYIALFNIEVPKCDSSDKA
jgi:hypothetical protein